MINWSENKYVQKLGCNYSRIVASFINAGGDFTPKFEKVADREYKIRSSDFENWLRSLGLDEEEVIELWEFATCGKVELENNAHKFLGHVKPAKKDS